MKYDEEQLKDIAKGIHRGDIFTSWQIDPPPALDPKWVEEMKRVWEESGQSEEAIEEYISNQEETTAERHAEMLRMVFPVLMFMDDEGREHLQEQKPVVFFEYMNKALPRGVNGMPMFMSMAYLNEEEANIVVGYIEKLQEAEKDL